MMAGNAVHAAAALALLLVSAALVPEVHAARNLKQVQQQPMRV
jgi:hypothetical protein